MIAIAFYNDKISISNMMTAAHNAHLYHYDNDNSIINKTITPKQYIWYIRHNCNANYWTDNMMKKLIFYDILILQLQLWFVYSANCLSLSNNLEEDAKEEYGQRLRQQ